MKQLKTKGGFGVPADILKSAKRDFESERVSDVQTLETIKQFYSSPSTNGAVNGDASKEGYILDPHSAIGVAASLRSIQRTTSSGTHHISLATAHPAKFAKAVDLALKDEEGFSFNTVLPKEFIGLEQKERRVTVVPKGAGWEGVRKIVEDEVEAELNGSK